MACRRALTATALPLLAVRPFLGRLFTEEDAGPGATAVVLVGHETWRTRLNGDPDVPGRMVRLNGEPAEIVGVMPESFGFPMNHQVWTPLHLDALRPERAQQGGRGPGRGRRITRVQIPRQSMTDGPPLAGTPD